jgi:hypothetical protein
LTKIDSRIEKTGLLKTFIHDGDSRQLMQINKKCRWKRFQKVGKRQPRVEIGVDYTK